MSRAETLIARANARSQHLDIGGPTPITTFDPPVPAAAGGSVMSWSSGAVKALATGVYVAALEVFVNESTMGRLSIAAGADEIAGPFDVAGDYGGFVWTFPPVALRAGDLIVPRMAALGAPLTIVDGTLRVVGPVG